MLVQSSEMDPTSKVWIFQSDKPVDSSKKDAIKAELNGFLTEWAAHNVQLYASGDLLHERFILIMVDERFTGTSGCSVDTLHRFIRHLENKYAISLLDRMQLAYSNDGSDQIYATHLSELPTLVQSNIITEDTYVFDNLVPTKKDFDDRWKVKIKNSWHKKFLNQ